MILSVSFTAFNCRGFNEVNGEVDALTIIRGFNSRIL
jgi:hypothetical protein